MQKEIETLAKPDFEQNFFCLKDRYAGQYGLYDGKAGLCMGAFLMHRNTDETAWKEEAMCLLDEVCENIGTVSQVTFASGLSGIGWALEWIVQNNFVEANTDDVLESLDDELFKAIIYSKTENLSLETGTMGLALFFYKRLMARNPYPPRYRNVYLIECLVLLVDNIHNELLRQEDALLNSAKPQDIKVIAQALVFASLIEPLRINHEKAKTIIKAIFKFIHTTSQTTAASTNSIYEPLWQARTTAACILKGSHYSFNNMPISNPSYNYLTAEKGFAGEKDGVYSLLSKTLRHEYGNWKEAWLHFF